MAILCQKNIFEFEVPVKDVMRLKVIDGPQYLFDVEMSDIDGKAAGFADLIPEVSRVDRLMSKRNRKRSKRGRYGKEGRRIP